MFPLIPLILTLAPQVAKWIFGDKGEEVTKDVAIAVQTVTGADTSTAEGVAAARAALDGKPELVFQLQQRLAEIAAEREAEANREADARRRDELEELAKRLTDVAGARQQTITLASSGSPLAWGSAVLSAIILIGFTTLLYLVINQQTDLKNQALVNILFGTLAAMATQVANYWLGSSSGSAHKNDILREQSNQLAAAAPGPILPPAAVAVASGSPVVAATPPSGSSPASSPTAAAPSGSATTTTDELNRRSLEVAQRDR